MTVCLSAPQLGHFNRDAVMGASPDICNHHQNKTDIGFLIQVVQESMLCKPFLLSPNMLMDTGSVHHESSPLTLLHTGITNITATATPHTTKKNTPQSHEPDFDFKYNQCKTGTTTPTTKRTMKIGAEYNTNSIQFPATIHRGHGSIIPSPIQ